METTKNAPAWLVKIVKDLEVFISKADGEIKANAIKEYNEKSLLLKAMNGEIKIEF
mgnify:FL=1